MNFLILRGTVMPWRPSAPLQRPKPPREQRPPPLRGERDPPLKPEPLVLAARVEEMDRDDHPVLQHPVAVRLAVGGTLLDVHMREAEAAEEDNGGRGIRK